jgi:membrane protein DedA with SNARE-associated domain
VDLLLLDLPLWINDLVDRFHYLGPFVILVLCGVGLPLPEEVTLIASGLMLYQGKVEFLPITLVCSLAILLGDSLPYLLGRKVGTRALENRFVAKVLHPERFAIVEEKFRRHGSLMVFFCRFLPGIRIPAYFTAGTLGMGYLRFLILDSLGVLISVPTSIWIAKEFGGKMDQMKDQMENFHLILAFILLMVLCVMGYRMVIRRRERQVRSMQEATLPQSQSGSIPPPPEDN